MIKKNFDFIGLRKYVFILSLALIAVIVLWALIGGVKMDVQFKGGTIITYSYTEGVDVNEFQSLVEDTLGQSVTIDQKSGLAGSSDTLDIVLAGSEGLESGQLEKLTTAVEEAYGSQLTFLSNSSVDPSIGNEFFIKGLVAIVLASILMIVYIGFRFRNIRGFSAGVTAVIALVHDCFMVFGCFVIFGIPLDSNFIAVILTILGYSLNDTVVIYDRIRENRRLYGKQLPLRELVNRSINESLSRAINTGIAVAGTLVIVCIVAVVYNLSSIITFAFPMLVGTIFGMYSSICIVSPLWALWQEKKEEKGKSYAAKKA